MAEGRVSEFVLDGVEARGPARWPDEAHLLRRPLCAVYAIVAQGGDREACVYVGKTECTVLERMRGHMKARGMVRGVLRGLQAEGVSIAVYWWPCPKIGHRFHRIDHREQLAIALLKPHLNCIRYVHAEDRIRRKFVRG